MIRVVLIAGYTAPMPPRDEDKTARQIARSKVRRDGDRSGRFARDLMELGAAVLKKLNLEEEMQEVVDRARKVTSHVARRRAERTLAGELRKFDLTELAEKLAKAGQQSDEDVRKFHLAEQWRAKLIEEGMAAAAEMPGAAGDEELPRLVDAARREKATGKPPGAARTLFRHVVGMLEAAEASAGSHEDEELGDDD